MGVAVRLTRRDRMYDSSLITRHSSQAAHRAGRRVRGRGRGRRPGRRARLAVTPRVVGSARVLLPRRPRATDVGDALAVAARQAVGGELSSVLAVGLLGHLPDGNVAECVAERTGLTVVTGFA